MMKYYFFKSIKCHTFPEPQARSDFNDDDDNDNDDDDFVHKVVTCFSRAGLVASAVRACFTEAHVRR